jgi:hypothetical protein
MSDNSPVIDGEAEELTPEQLAEQARIAELEARDAAERVLVMEVQSRAHAVAAERGWQVRNIGRQLPGDRWFCVVEKDGAFEVHELSDPPQLVRIRGTHRDAEAVLHRLMEGKHPEEIPGDPEPPPPAPTPYGSSPEALLQWEKDDAKRRIDRNAEQARLRYVTAGAGQAMAYKAKEEEARMVTTFAPGVDLDPSAFPFLALEAEATGQTLRQVAQVVVAAADLWRQVGARIEVLRLSAKRAVEAAASESEVRVAARVEWP